ncbi:hypothetical protein FXN61_29495 [Lentzea sp. PSKA42]|uniref:Uncharacterized protein n=1 Tax=Lentzea indica TaxID=2604800 RepID=A0ABX1FPI6_9PSEU|nr:hypothetical protein [Lentzea indica]NKE60702.1 hypothetical protein [Lentzea indica]
MPLAAVQPDVPAPLKPKGKTVQTKNVVEAVRSRLGAALGRGRTAPTEAGTVASKPRPRRLIVLALAATLAALPISAAVQTVGAPKAQAAVDDRYSWVYPGTAAMVAFNFWQNRWPATGPQNAQFRPSNGQVINGGGTYNDRDSQLRNWIGHVTGNWAPLHFREYDAAIRPAGSNRGAGRYVYNVEYGVIFHSADHYANFAPLNFGSLPIPWFNQTVYCYEHPAGQVNNRRIVLHNPRSNPVEFTVAGLPGSGMSVQYHRTWQWWHSDHHTYYVDDRAHNYDDGRSFNAFNAFRMHNRADLICREFTPFWNGHF